MSRRLLLLAALALAVGFAPAPLPRRERASTEEQDLRRLQGTWVVVKYLSNGRDILGQQGSYLFTFEGRRTICLQNNHRSEWTYELSAATSPRQITSKEAKGNVVLKGIYRFEGDTFVLCETVGDGPRPTEFGSKGSTTLLVMRRR
jgi:uncharacterized protein (TIGR03067 family)